MVKYTSYMGGRGRKFYSSLYSRMDVLANGHYALTFHTGSKSLLLWSQKYHDSTIPGEQRRGLVMVRYKVLNKCLVNK